MAHVLTITYASTTITLTSGDYSIMEDTYSPGVGDGNTVEETLQVRIKAETVATLKTDVEALWLAAREAADYQADGKEGYIVYVNFQPNGAAASFRSELMKMSLSHSPTMFSAQEWGNTKSTNIYTWITITWTRADYWEGPHVHPTLVCGSQTGSPLDIFNPSVREGGTAISIDQANKHIHSSDITNQYLTLFRTGETFWIRGSSASNDGTYTVATGGTGDSTHPLIVTEALGGDESANANLTLTGASASEIVTDGTELVGDLPSPVIITLINQSSLNIKNLLIYTTYKTTLGMTHLEDSPYSSVDWVSTSDTNSSGGFQWQCTLGAAYKLIDWAVGAQTTAYYGILCRFAANPPANTYARAYFDHDGAHTYIEYGKEVLLDAASTFQLIDFFPIAPFHWKPAPAESTTAKFGVEFKNAGAGTLKLDFVELVGLESMCKVNSISGYGFANGDTMVIDAIHKSILVRAAGGTDIYNDFAIEGDFPMFKPGSNNHMKIFRQHATGTTYIGSKMKFSIEYYPRYHTI